MMKFFTGVTSGFFCIRTVLLASLSTLNTSSGSSLCHCMLLHLSSNLFPKKPKCLRWEMEFRCCCCLRWRHGTWSRPPSRRCPGRRNLVKDIHDHHATVEKLLFDVVKIRKIRQFLKTKRFC